MLENPASFVAIEQPALEAEAVAPVAGWKRALPWGVAGLAVAAALVIGLLAGGRAGALRRAQQFLGPTVDALEIDPGWGDSIAFSPDGSRLVSVVSEQVLSLGENGSTFLEVREIGQLEGRRLADTAGARQPFFSPDGQWIGYFAGGKLRKISVTGGASFELADVQVNRGGTWSEDGTIYYTPHVNSGIMKVPASGGAAEAVTELATGERSHRWPRRPSIRTSPGH